MSKPRIGFIGVGMMGHGMAKNLVAKGYPLTFLAHRNRSRLQDLLDAGAKEARKPAELAAASDIVFLCVTGSPQVEENVFGEAGSSARRVPGCWWSTRRPPSRARRRGSAKRSPAAARPSSTPRSRARRRRPRKED
jgi:hypothetical protein